ncbi:CIA30 family protein [Pseudoalteromonas sp. Hal099]
MSDSVMGGQSVATLTTNKNSLTIDTTITKPTSFGAWAGAEIKFTSPADASAFKGIRLTYKGSSTPFALSVYHNDVKDWDSL